MTSLIACLSTGKGTWAQLSEIINTVEWEKVFLITSEFGKEKFSRKPNMELLVVDFNQSSDILSDQIVAKLRDKNIGTEVAINLTSGSGNEHMALLSAVMKLGLGIRFVFSKNGKAEELKLFNTSFH